MICRFKFDNATISLSKISNFPTPLLANASTANPPTPPTPKTATHFFSNFKIQGIGAGFIPKVLNTDIYDEIIEVEDEEAFSGGRKMAKEEGIFPPISQVLSFQNESVDLTYFQTDQE